MENINTSGNRFAEIVNELSEKVTPIEEKTDSELIEIYSSAKSSKMYIVLQVQKSLADPKLTPANRIALLNNLTRLHYCSFSAS